MRAQDQAGAVGQYQKPSKADKAKEKLLDIAELIRSLEGLPVDYGLARHLTETLKRIEGSV